MDEVGAVTSGLRRRPVGDGRVVGVWEYGDPDGFPVLAFHGTPACGVGFAVADEVAARLGVRLLAPDRPGVGVSSPSPGWTVAGYVDQVRELADALDLARFAVWGYSGGGPYAVACATLLGDRTTAAAVTAGMGEIGVWARPGDFDCTDQTMTWLAARHPRVAELLLSATGRVARLRPSAALRGFERELPSTDREFIRSARTAPDEAVAVFTEAVRHGAAGVAADYVATSGPWNLELEHIRIPLAIWHGDEDTTVPLAHSEELARRVPGSTLTVWPGVGHLGPLIHCDQILATLVPPF